MIISQPLESLGIVCTSCLIEISKHRAPALDRNNQALLVKESSN